MPFSLPLIYTNSTEEDISVILLQKDEESVENPIAFMSPSLLDVEMKYTLIEKHAYALVKVVEKFHHFILSKHIEIKSPFA